MRLTEVSIQVNSTKNYLPKLDPIKVKNLKIISG